MGILATLSCEGSTVNIKKIVPRRIASLIGATLAAFLIVLTGNVLPVDETMASWQDPTFVGATFSAGTMSPPASLSCVVITPTVLPTVTFMWTLPVGGATRISYHWYLSNANGTLTPTPTDGILGAGATSYTLLGNNNWPAGTTMNFRLVATGLGAWESTPILGTASNGNLGLVTTCTTG